SGDGGGDAGIEICCGAFELAGVGKSVIADNTISNNADDGIHIDSSFGLNIGPNNIISNNGQNPAAVVPSGIEIVNTTSAAIFAATGDVVPVNGNTITENSIFGNQNAVLGALGIDLNGGGGTGCAAKGVAPIDPNDCIAHPVITLVAADGKVGGTTCANCTVEIFLADEAPDDQPGVAPDLHLGVQHGEGRTFLQSGVADADGDFTISLVCGQGAGILTATATDEIQGNGLRRSWGRVEQSYGAGPVQTGPPDRAAAGLRPVQLVRCSF
ncbi:MAG: right-handed parallel beta-helix repeat-containing protein, partial [Planctomycetes bacterium]|nr:right-handed parallel beta-helix repeat-containing protein [Planctomycetota bacterium]